MNLGAAASEGALKGGAICLAVVLTYEQYFSRSACSTFKRQKITVIRRVKTTLERSASSDSAALSPSTEVYFVQLNNGCISKSKN